MSINKFESEIASLKRANRRNTILSGVGTVVEHTPAGSRVHVVEMGTGGSSYWGFLKLSIAYSEEAEDNVITITNGSPLSTEGICDEDVAGFAIINDLTIEMPTAELSIEQENGLIIATFTLGSSTASFDSYDIRDGILGNEENKLNIILGSFYTENQQIKVIQQHHGMIYGWIFRHCEEIEL